VVGWDEGGVVRAGNCNFINGKGNENQLGMRLHHRIVSAVKREFVSGRMSYIVLRCRW
jgi:hypothetical protein